METLASIIDTNVKLLEPTSFVISFGGSDTIEIRQDGDVIIRGMKAGNDADIFRALSLMSGRYMDDYCSARTPTR